MPDTALRHVFVYGTLRRGESNDITRLRPAPRWLGQARVPGTLYDLGPYPGLVLDGAGQVLGEVYAIEAALERQLDLLEDVAPPGSGEYRRRELTLRLSGASLRCLVYEIDSERVRGRPRIDGGDWAMRATASPR